MKPDSWNHPRTTAGESVPLMHPTPSIGSFSSEDYPDESQSISGGLGQLLTDCADDLFLRLNQIEAEIVEGTRKAELPSERSLRAGMIRESLPAQERESDPYVEFDGRDAYQQWLVRLDAEDAHLSERVCKWLLGLPRSAVLDDLRANRRVDETVERLCDCLTQLSLRFQSMLPPSKGARDGNGLLLTLGSSNSGTIGLVGGGPTRDMGELVEECLEFGGGFGQRAEVRELRGPVLAGLAHRELEVPGFVQRSAGVFYLARRRSPRREGVLEPAESFPGEEEMLLNYPELHDDLEAVVCLVAELAPLDAPFVARRLELLLTHLPSEVDCLAVTLKYLQGQLGEEPGRPTEQAAW